MQKLDPLDAPRQPGASWELMESAARGIPVPRRQLRTAIRRCRSLMDEALGQGGDLEAVAMARCAVIFGALATLWVMKPHDVEELWTSGLLECALDDEFSPRGRLGAQVV